MKNTNFWAEQAPRPDDLPVTENLPDLVDVVIVGSGYTGLNAARVLAKNGASVAVLESETIGWGASSRNGGMATPGLKQDIKVAAKQYGMATARKLWDGAMEAVTLLDGIIKEEKIDCDWHMDGNLYVASKARHFKSMRSRAGWLKENMGYEMGVVSPSEMRNHIGTDKYHGGLVGKTAGGLHPAKYIYGLARAIADNYGVQLCEDAQVTAIKRIGEGFEVQTTRGVVKAKEVVVATNGYTDKIVKGLKPHVFPVGSYIVVTEPLSQELQDLISPKRHMFYDSKWFLNYFRLTADGRMLWGGRNDLSTGLDLTTSARILGKQLRETFPELRGIPLTHSWTGKLGITFDLVPHVGQIDGVHYALGYGGHGLSIATYVGTELGLMMAGKKEGNALFDLPQQTMFFYRDKAWFLRYAAMYYRFLDSVM